MASVNSSSSFSINARPKSSTFTMPFRLTSKVARLDVAVHHSFFVRVLQTGGGLGNQAARLGPGNRALSHDQFLHADPLDELHDDIQNFVRLAELESAHDVRVIQEEPGPRFELEPRQVIVVHVLGNDFDGGLLAGLLVDTDVQPAHPAGSQDIDDAIVVDHELLELAFEQPLGLEFRQDTLQHQLLQELDA